MEEASVEIQYQGKAYPFVTPKMGDLVAFERQFKVKASALQPEPKVTEDGVPVLDVDGEPVFESQASIEWMCFLMYRSLIRQGVINRKETPFDEDFLDDLGEVDAESVPVEAMPAEDPTVRALPTG